MLKGRWFINIHPKTLGMLVSSLSFTHNSHQRFLKLGDAVGCTHGEIRCPCCQGLPSSLALTSENAQALKAGQYTHIIMSDFKSAAGCSQHKDKSNLSFAGWESKERFMEQEQPNTTVQPHCPQGLQRTEVLQNTLPQDLLTDPILPCSENMLCAGCHSSPSHNRINLLFVNERFSQRIKQRNWRLAINSSTSFQSFRSDQSLQDYSGCLTENHKLQFCPWEHPSQKQYILALPVYLADIMCTLRAFLTSANFRVAIIFNYSR